MNPAKIVLHLLSTSYVVNATVVPQRYEYLIRCKYKYYGNTIL